MQVRPTVRRSGPMVLAVVAAGSVGCWLVFFLWRTGGTSAVVLRNLGDAKVEISKSKMRNITQAISMFQMRKNRIPSSLSELCGPEDDDARFLESEEPPKDAWGGEFQYNPRDKKNYDLVCLGDDGQPGGDGNARDFASAEVVR